MVLARVAKLNEQETIFKTLPSFFLYSLLHEISKTFIKSFIGFAFVQYRHHTFSGNLKM